MIIEDGVLKPTGVIQLRGGTAEVLSEVNPMPERREIMCEVDTGRIKVGDGIHAWNALPYSGGGGTVTQATATGVSIELTATHIAQGYVSLPADCDFRGMIKVYVNGLLAGVQDFVLSQNIGGAVQVSWSGCNLESILQVGDTLFIEYFKLS